MRTIAHISDLHFGMENPAVAEGLQRDLAKLSSSLVVVSGDLTQRARPREFLLARDFLQRLPKPQLVIPGNHDIPFYDVVRRFLFPLHRFRRYINPVVCPTFQDEELAVLGINTARSWTFKNGRISYEQIELLRRRLQAVPEDSFKVVVTHHPFIPPPGDVHGAIALVGRAAQALTILEEGGVSLLLAGHLHHGYTGDVRTFHPLARRSMIVAQAGTAISERVRHEPNAYNWITIEPGHLSIEVRVWDGTVFRPDLILSYRLKVDTWMRQED